MDRNTPTVIRIHEQKIELSLLQCVEEAETKRKEPYLESNHRVKN